MKDWYEQVWENAPADPEPWAWERRRRWLLDEARPGERVLDLGCGAGRFLGALGDAGCTPVGIEIAEAALSRARSNAPRAELHLASPDGELPIADGSIKLVWCSEVIEHVADTTHFLDEIIRVLVPGGRVLLTTPFHGRLQGAALALGRFDTHFDPLGQHLRFYTRSSLARVLETSRLTDVRVQAVGGFPLLRRALIGRARKAAASPRYRGAALR